MMKTYALGAVLLGLTNVGCTTEAYCFVCDDPFDPAATGGAGGTTGGTGGTGVVITGGSGPNDGGEGGDPDTGTGGAPDTCDDTQSDPFNCGSCGNECSFQNAFAECVNGECRIDACFPGYLDANDLEGDGCEKGCVETNGGVELCDDIDNDCDGEVDEDFDFSSVDSCGSCSNVCNLSHANEACVEVATDEYKCQVDTCEANYYDIDDVHENGCEYSCTVDNGGVEECDGQDDNCDGTIDEGAPGADQPCTDVCPDGDSGTPGIQCVGQCTPGRTICAGTGIVCVPDTRPGSLTVGPSLEVCDEEDNDCDGQTDEGFAFATDVNNCGGCGNVCDDLPNTKVEKCVASKCEVQVCEDGFADLSSAPGDEGCEHECDPLGWPPTPEVCDGIDNDCDGLVDADDPDLPAAPFSCVNTGACAGTINECINGEWTCNYPANVDLDPNVDYVTSGYTPPETLCDGLDNNCDLRIDEGVGAYDDCTTGAECGSGTCNQGRCTCANDNHCGFGYVCNTGFCRPTCTAGKGECANDGFVTCSGGAAACNASAAPLNARPETCNGLDDNCDGFVDERTPGDDPATATVETPQTPIVCYNSGGSVVPCGTLTDQMVQVGSFWIYKYEASRPDATASSSGILDDGRSCSVPGRQPWTYINQQAAQEACGMVRDSAGNPMTLCSEANWEAACRDTVAAGTTSWSFASNPTTHVQNTCNDRFVCGTGASCTGGGTCVDGFCTCTSNAQCQSREICSMPSCTSSAQCSNGGTCVSGTCTVGFCSGVPWATGSGASCYTDIGTNDANAADDIFDLSGNVAEWTSTASGTDYFRVRGGSYSSFSPASACNFSFVLAKETFANADVGFRCCSTAAP